MYGVSQQYDAPIMPVFRFERGEADPLRVIREQRCALQIAREQLLAIGNTLCLARFVQPGLQPRLFVAFDDEGAGIAAEGVGMHLKEAVFVLAENKGEGIKYLVRAEPDIARLALRDARLKVIGISPAHDAVDAVGGDQQIIIIVIAVSAEL